MGKWMHCVWQIGLLYLIALGSNALVDWLHVPVPGSIVGIAVLFALLQAKIVKVEWLDAGVKWLHGDLLLFFIPATVGIMQYAGLLRTDGIAVGLTVVVSTVLVMACAGYAAQRIAGRTESTAEGDRVGGGASKGV